MTYYEFKISFDLWMNITLIDFARFLQRSFYISGIFEEVEFSSEIKPPSILILCIGSYQAL